MFTDLRMAFIVTRREVRDQFRDWRIIFPIIVLTIFFPGLMNFTAKQAVAFVERYGAPVVADRLIPFLLMVVGFFPISISLVIALESFVGEKERRSIEPLLSSPLSNSQIYLGKLMAAMIPPLIGAYLGITVYLIGIKIQVGWTPEPILLSQIILLTAVHGILMVSGAVVLSSQTTSVRAANLLASFIIIPVALLIQAESIIMFWAIYSVLWWILAGLVVIVSLLIRTGLAYFNREELLGRELDMLNFYWGWQVFKKSFIGRAQSPLSWYRREVLGSIGDLKLPIICSTLAILFGIGVGIHQANEFALPASMIQFNQLDKGFIEGLELLNFFSPTGVLIILFQNLRVVVLASVFGIFSFGVLGMLILILPLGLIAYIGANVAAAGYSAGTFLVALVLPHGLLEIPAIILTGAAILSLGGTLASPAQGKTIGEAWLIALARWAKIIIGLVIPLFLAAALVEVYITPYIAIQLLGI
jgi:uncharacterized membrane protein SpoIIM required for sporulation